MERKCEPGGLTCLDSEVGQQRYVRGVDENGYEYLGVSEGAALVQKEMKKKVKLEYLGRVKLVVRLKLCSGNLIRAINACGEVQ